jgi:hydroxyacylglutathione hydrolase
MLQLKIFPFNPLQVNAYLLYEKDGPGILIDPSCMDQWEFKQLADFIRGNNINLMYQVNTHCHFDHLFGVGMVKKAFGSLFFIHKDDEPFVRLAGDQARSFGFDFEGDVPAPDAFLSDSDLIIAESIELKVIHVPGHSKGGLSFYEATQGWLFSGDSLFAGGIGRTDLPGGDYDELISSINNRLMILPSKTVVYPGHGPSSTIERELKSNPFL